MPSAAMRYSVKDSELRDPATRGPKLRAMLEATRRPPNGEVTEIEERISAFERLHGISSAKMQSEIASGARPETREMLDWLLLIKRRQFFSER